MSGQGGSDANRFRKTAHMMVSAFQNHIDTEFAFIRRKKLLVAVSGGLDSMVLANLLIQAGFDVSVAHCDFSLRGAESDGDADFVRAFADENQVPFYLQKFDTEKFASDANLSIQMAARELRYRWFEEVRSANNLDFICTAHHANDNLETFLINFSRGTGIEGLTGIPKQNGHIIRPLLPFTRNEILAYADSEKIDWREDSSNASGKYLRNKIRHEIIPILESIQPKLMQTFSKTQLHLQQTQTMAEDASIMVYQRVATESENEIIFNLDELLKLPNYGAYLYQWLREFGFTQWDDIEDLTNGISGKQIHSQTHTLLRDRSRLLLFPMKASQDASEYKIESPQTSLEFPVKLAFKKVESAGENANTTIFVDADALEFPLELRTWRQGDTFLPLGMGGKSKKLSKFLKDEKVALHDKLLVWVLLSKGEIVWVIGRRMDERFKIQPQTTNILRITTQ